MEDKDLPKTTFAVVDQVTNVNFRPHPFTVGVKNVSYASERNGGMLTNEVCEAVGCEHVEYRRTCGLPPSDHTSDKVAFVKFTAECTNAEASEWLKSLAPWCEENKIDGFAFIETGIRPH